MLYFSLKIIQNSMTTPMKFPSIIHSCEKFSQINERGIKKIENNFSSLLFEFKRKKEETRLLIKQLILVKKIVLLLAFTFNYVNGLTNKMSSLMAYNSIIVYIIIYKTTYLLKSICLALLSI